MRNRFGRVARSNLAVWIIALLLLALATWFAEQQQATRDPFAPPPAWTTPAWWVEPIERNAFLRLPSISTDLNDIHFTDDGLRGWVVGRDGTILATRNGGASWTRQTSGTNAWLHSVHFSGDGLRGWIVGDNGTVLTTRDGGTSWIRQNSGTGLWLNKVHFSDDGLRGWIVGGTILTTEDGGDSWISQSSGTKVDLTSLHFAKNGKRGWIVGENGTILATRDGGSSWFPQPSGTEVSLRHVQFSSDGIVGQVIGDDGVVLVTRDGGSSWRSQQSGGDIALTDAHISDDGLHRWVIGLNGTIRSSSDGGESWKTQDSQTTARLLGLFVSGDGSRAWIIGDSGVLLATRDGGASWRHQFSGLSGIFVHTQLMDGSPGFVVSLDGSVLTTDDAGETWQSRHKGKEGFVFGAHFADDGLRGWTVGDNGKIRVTGDGGQEWKTQPSSTRARLLGTRFDESGLRGWVVGDLGTLLHSLDGGTSWGRVATGARADLVNLHFINNGLRGWVIGFDGTILSSRDGGESWNPQFSGTGADLTALHFTNDGQLGWAVGSQGTILSTRNGGALWQQQVSQTTIDLADVFFARDGRQGWVVGGQGTILATSNSGTTWQFQNSGTRADLIRVRLTADGQRGWIVGANGTILYTRDGGTSWQATLYQRSPAPWYWVTLALILLVAAGFCISIEARTLPLKRFFSIANNGRSDEPVSSIDQDRLNFRPIVDGLADYLRNSETRPPLTIAINAPWGQGKSSFMRMLQQRMEGHGVQCVWFNTWHHQKEKVLLAALLQAIREQALPPPFGWHGLRFRLRLLRRRLSAHPWMALLGLGGFAYPLLHLFSDFVGWIKDNHDPGRSSISYFLDYWVDIASRSGGSASLHDLLNGSGLVDVLWAMLKQLSPRPDALVDALAILVFLAFTFVLVQYGLRAFPGSPAVLLTSLSRGAKLTGLDDQTSYREKFKRHYRDVCASLGPRYPVLFIDDLDRCEPEKTAEMLEAVNFLSNSGECFIVLGMARDVVEAQLALNYKDLATQHASQTAPNDQDTPAEIDYVRRYLRKLVNLDIRLPSLNAERLRSMLELEKGTADSRGAWTHALDTLQHAWEAWIARAMRWTLLSLAMLYFATSLTDGLNTWKDDQHKAARSARAEIEKIEKHLEIRSRQLHATLDIARGRSEQAASEVFRRTGIALPSEYARLSQDVRKTIDAKAPGHLPGKTFDPCVPQTDKASAGSASSAYTQTNAREERPPATRTARVLECWRHREALRLEIEETLKAVRDGLGTRTGISAGDTQKELESLERRLEEVLLRAERETGLAEIQKVSSVSVGTPSPQDRSKQIGAVFVDHREPNSTAWRESAFAALLSIAALLPIAALFILRRDPYQIQDGEPFKMALELWHPLLAMRDDLATPREIRRFENRARYYAMRLRPHPPQRKSQLRRFAEWLDRRGGGKPPDSPPDAKTSIPEELIVGLSAIRHAAPEHIDLAAAQNEEPGENEPRMRRAVAVFLRRHRDRARETNKATNGSGTARKFEYWTITPSQLEQFLEVAGEYNAPTSAARK